MQFDIPSRHLTACYTQSGIAAHDTNPCIAALPPIRSDDDWLQRLTVIPEVEPDELALPAHIRSYKVVGLKELFVPTEELLRHARRLDQLIRWGYEQRNPVGPDRARTLQAAYELGQSGKAEFSSFRRVPPMFSYSLIGASGLGKSVSTERVLATYPQYLLHPSLNLHQLVWLKVETPRDGSVRELGMNILRGIDEVLGTEHAPQHTRYANASAIMAKVCALASTYCLGLLVLDELQNLSVKKSGGREEMLNWVQELINELHLPVALIGTYKAKKILSLDARHARRNTATGSAFWKPLARNSEEFAILVESAWECQWLRERGPLTDEVMDTVFEETQGIRAFVIDVLMVCQVHALRSGSEAITPALIKHVARREFAPVQHVIKAMRSGDPRRLALLDDIADYDVDEMLERGRSGMQAASFTPTRTASGSFTAAAVANVQSALGVNRAEAEYLVSMAAGTTPPTSAKALTQKAIDLFTQQRSNGTQPAL